MAAVLLFSGCSRTDNQESASPQTTESETASLITADISSGEQQSSAQESSLPEQLSPAREGFLKYISPKKSMTAVFPQDFSVLREDYKTLDGILLQNQNGSASLQLESLSGENITRTALTDYLTKTYPQASISLRDSKTVICKTPVTDKKGNHLLAYMKAVISPDGYNEAVLYFNEKDKSEFESVFDKISVSD